MSRAKRFLDGLLAETILGAIDYWRRPNLRASWGGPFNGQRNRAALFLSLMAKFQPRALIETGTFRGTTTEFMSKTGVPIFTVESVARNYGFARMRLSRLRHVHVRRGDSRHFIRELFQGPLRNYADQTVFAYLDAHGEGDLPLAEEIDLIFEYWPAAVVMIDDFQVPSDAGYRYDVYRSGKALTPAYIATEVNKHALQLFFPSVPASHETGSRRGCVVLAKTSTHAAALAAMPELRSLNVEIPAHVSVGQLISYWLSCCTQLLTFTLFPALLA